MAGQDGLHGLLVSHVSLPQKIAEAGGATAFDHGPVIDHHLVGSICDLAVATVDSFEVRAGQDSRLGLDGAGFAGGGGETGCAARRER